MLTQKQELFVQKIMEGMNQADAYRAAYSTANTTDKTIWENASRLMANPKVSARLKELRDMLASETVMSAQKRLEWLTELVKDTSEYTCNTDKLKAIDIMNKMTGEYTTKVEANVNSDVTINIELTDD